MQDEELKAVRLKAMELLARREHSALEMRRKLMQRGFSRESIELVIAEFSQQSFLSDTRFAEQYLENRMQKGYGPIKIEQELKARGLDDQIIRQCFREVEDQWENIVRRVYNRRFSQDIADDKERLRRMRYLNQRGFTSDQIKRVIEIEDYV